MGPPQWVLVAGAAVLSATLYAVAYVQVRRRFPDRATGYLLEALATAAGSAVACWADGWSPVAVAAAPAGVAAVGFLAGKGSVAALLPDGRDGEEMPPGTARARRRFGVIAVVLLVLAAVYLFATN